MKNIYIAALVLLLVIVNVLRFSKLDSIPKSSHVDEYAAAVSLQCMAKQGTGPFGGKPELFLQQGFGTPKPPIYTYSALLWTKIFGFKVDAIRAFSAFNIVVGVIGLFFLGRLIAGYKAGLWAAVAASISPWSWCLGRLGFESFFAPVALIWGMFLFFRKKSFWDDLLAGLLFCASAYFYPPARLFIPLFLIFLVGFEIIIRREKHYWWLLMVALALPAIPLIHYQLIGQLSYRINEVSIWQPAYLSMLGNGNKYVLLSEAFEHNYLAHLSPKYLFVTGDPDLTHSTQKAGLLSWLDITAWAVVVFGFICYWIKIKEKNLWQARGSWIIFCGICFLISIVPAGLTFIDIPNALRMCLGWPFLCLITGLTMAWICEWQALIPFLMAVLVTGYISFYLKDFFTNYAERSKYMFAFWIEDETKQIKSNEDWLKFLVQNYDKDYHERYYLMNQMGQSCSESFQVWLNVLGLVCHQNPQAPRCSAH